MLAKAFKLFITSDSGSESTTIMSETKTVPNAVKFLFGGSAGMYATCFVQPLDLVKNRMQVVIIIVIL